MTDVPENNEGQPEDQNRAPAPEKAGAIAPNDGQTQQVSAKRANVKANQVVLSTSPLPSIAEMEWMKENCPEFLDSFQKDILEESSHRRRMENKGQNTSRYLGTLVILLCAFITYTSDPWAAVGMFAAATLLVAAAFVFLSLRGRGTFPNITAEGRSVEQNEEHINQID